MLKSKRIGDGYHNVSLSNLKILSTTRNTCKGVAERYLRHIDETIRDIESLECGDVIDNEVPGNDADIPHSEPEDIGDQFEEKVSASKEEEEIPILLSIQYNDYQDVLSAVEGFLKERQHTYQPEATPVFSCNICASVEIVHSEKLAQLSAWRKNFMSQLNLKTTAFTD